MDISAGGAGKGIVDALAGAVDIGMVSRTIHPAEIEKGAWWVAVTKDAVVAVVNENNPLVAELLGHGLKRETLAAIWLKGTVATWEAALERGGNHPIHLYTRSDACGAGETWAQYLGKKQEDLLGIGVYGDPGLADAVKKDLLGIGYNNVNYAYDAASKRPVAGLRILPLDLNGNGRVETQENFYGQRDELVAAIADGRYPNPPARELYFVCRGRPTNKTVARFIRWVLSDGQRFVADAGYIRLADSTLQAGVAKLGD